MNQVTEHVFAIDAGALSVYLIVLPDTITLIDTGFPGTMNALDDALRSLGRRPEDVRDVLVTHCHPDHAGGLAEIKKATGAQAWMHPADAALVREGTAFRPWRVSPGLSNRLVATLVIKRSARTFEPAEVERDALPGETIPVAGGIRVLWTPGHTAGHLVFLWPGDGGVLFLGDAAGNVKRLAPSPIYEDLALGLQSLRKLGEEDFGTVCFAHGASIVGDAAEVFRRRWGGPGSTA